MRRADEREEYIHPDTCVQGPKDGERDPKSLFHHGMCIRGARQKVDVMMGLFYLMSQFCSWYGLI